MDYKDKIRKLLALAKSPEPEEAKLALLKARKLMAEHKLTERDLEEHDTTVIQQEIDETFSKKANSWMAPLSSIIGENYCCAAYRCKRGAKTTVWRVGFIGLKDDFEICVKIFRYAVRCVKSEQKKLRKQHRDYTIRKDGKVPKRYVSRSGELSESVAACENGCGVYWEDEDFSIGQDGMFYDNKYTEDGQA